MITQLGIGMDLKFKSKSEVTDYLLRPMQMIHPALTILLKCLKYRNFLAIKAYLFIFPLTLLEILRVIIQLANNRLMPLNSTSTKSRFLLG